MSPTIRVRVFCETPEPHEINEPPKLTFWRSRMPNYDASIESLENRLRRHFGRKLHMKLIEYFRNSLREWERATYGEKLYYILKDRPLHNEYASDWDHTLSSLVELRQRYLAEYPDYSKLVSAMLCISNTQFTTKIIRYSSLEFGITASNALKLLEAFDNNADTLKIMLDQFIPDVFNAIFPNDCEDNFGFQIDLDIKEPTDQVTRQQHTCQDRIADNRIKSFHNFDWYWKLVNGSLFIPVILTLFVLYHIYQHVVDLKDTQVTTMKPVLDHYQLLLEEDRRRLKLERELKSPVSKRNKDEQEQ